MFVTKQFRFIYNETETVETTWGNNDWIFIFGWTVPLNLNSECDYWPLISSLISAFTHREDYKGYTTKMTIKIPLTAKN